MEFTNSFVLEALSREFPESVISSSEPFGMLTLEIKKEMTTSEIIELIKKEDNIFNKYFGEISELFESYDRIKYTKNENISDKELMENSRQIRIFIGQISI